MAHKKNGYDVDHTFFLGGPLLLNSARGPPLVDGELLYRLAADREL